MKISLLRNSLFYCALVIGARLYILSALLGAPFYKRLRLPRSIQTSRPGYTSCWILQIVTDHTPRAPLLDCGISSTLPALPIETLVLAHWKKLLQQFRLIHLLWFLCRLLVALSVDSSTTLFCLFLSLLPSLSLRTFSLFLSHFHFSPALVSLFVSFPKWSTATPLFSRGSSSLSFPQQCLCSRYLCCSHLRFMSSLTHSLVCAHSPAVRGRAHTAAWTATTAVLVLVATSADAKRVPPRRHTACPTPPVAAIWSVSPIHAPCPHLIDNRHHTFASLTGNLWAATHCRLIAQLPAPMYSG